MNKSMTNMSMTLAEFERLLDIYGGERTRWPAEARAAAAHLVSRDAAARRLLAEAEALDRVLERAPSPALAAEAALAERIVAAAQRSPRMVKLPRPDGVAPLRAMALPAQTTGRRTRRLGLFSKEAGAVGFLAASLVFGVVIGRSELPPQTLMALADMTGLGGDSLLHIALSDEVMQ
jgi:hypothetical protein